MRAKLIRISRGLRQIDLASLAHVEPLDISIFEQDGLLSRKKRERICQVLVNLENETDATNENENS